MPDSSRKNLPDIAIIAAGTFATALAVALSRRGYGISEIVSRKRPQSVRRAKKLAAKVGSRATTLDGVALSAKTVWICVPDDAIPDLVQELASDEWNGKFVLHSSGALSSEVLDPLRKRGAHIASAHPLMTFTTASTARLEGVPFAVERDVRALTQIKSILRSLGGKPFHITAELKAAYHAFGFFSSPALVALLMAAQQVGELAGFGKSRARELMEPIVRQTVDNFFSTSPGVAFSGPMRRGDIATVRKHLNVLKEAPELLEVYCALAEIALRDLPVGNRKALAKLLRSQYRLR